jgi:hypothetical protein
VKAHITVDQVAAILRAILKVTGARNAKELNTLNVTKERWREAYDLAGVHCT